MQTKRSVLGHHIDLGVHAVAAAARRMGILAAVAAVVVVVAEQRYQARQLSREPEHHAEELAAVDSGRSADFVSLRQEVSAVLDHPWM